MKPVKIGNKKWYYVISAVIGAIALASNYASLGNGEVDPVVAFVFLVASLATLISTVQLIRHKPELVITTSGIKVKRSLHWYTWDQISAVRSFCKIEEEGDDQYFLVLVFYAGKDHRIDVSLLEKNVHEIAALVQQYSARSNIYQGHFTV